MDDKDTLLSTQAALAVWRIERQPRAVVPVLARGLQDDDERIRAFAARSAGEMGADARDLAAPLRAALRDESAEVRASAARALWRVERQSKEAVPVLLAAWKDGSFASIPMTSRLPLVEALAEMGEQEKSVVPVLVEMARGEPYRVSRAATKAAKQLDPKAAAEAGLR
jgi:HEAT repeat protein